jgi:hypothetical protein
MDSNQNMVFFRARRQQVVVSQIFGKSAVTMARLSCEHKRHGIIDPPVHEDAFFLAFNLRNYSGDLWGDGKTTGSTLSRAGNFTLDDYRRSWLRTCNPPSMGWASIYRARPCKLTRRIWEVSISTL